MLCLVKTWNPPKKQVETTKTHTGYFQVWDYFTETPKLCNLEMAYHSSRIAMDGHLKRKHLGALCLICSNDEIALFVYFLSPFKLDILRLLIGGPSELCSAAVMKM